MYLEPEEPADRIYRPSIKPFPRHGQYHSVLSATNHSTTDTGIRRLGGNEVPYASMSHDVVPHDTDLKDANTKVKRQSERPEMQQTTVDTPSEGAQRAPAKQAKMDHIIQRRDGATPVEDRESPE